MNAIPAHVAGVKRIVMVTPASGGSISPLVLAAARIAGVDEIYRVGGAQAVAARTVHTNVDRIATEQDAPWHALTWLWRTEEAYQRVTVVVSQIEGQREPPLPHALTLRNSLIEPLLWVMRQQPDAPGGVAAEVRNTADTIAAQIVGAAAPA
jgi:hypothetical protein